MNFINTTEKYPRYFFFIFAILTFIVLAGCNGDDSNFKISVIKGKLLAKSQIPTLDDILPYRDALVVYEYKVEKKIKGKTKGKNVRVVHWVIRDKQPQEISKARIGENMELQLCLFDDFESLQTIFISDDLEIDPKITYYHHIGQKIMHNQSVVERYDYRCSLSDTMPAFWTLKDQLKLVALGDSRGLEGIKAKIFYGDKNSSTPIAYNLSVTSGLLDIQQILINEYLLKLPRLEWVVYQMSPRIVNRHYSNGIARSMKRSPAYKFDCQHRNEIWLASENSEVTTANLDSTPYISKSWKDNPWGWKRAEQVWKNPKTGRWRKKWQMSKEHWENLEAMVKALDKNNIKILIYLSPIHPVIIKTQVVDDDGTTKEGYRELVQRLKEMQSKYDNMVFADLLKAGNHDFDPNMFVNLDHLNVKGAEKLTAMLEAIRKQIEAES